MEKNVTNWEGRVGLDPNMYNVTLLDLFFLNSSLTKESDEFQRCELCDFELMD